MIGASIAASFMPRPQADVSWSPLDNRWYFPDLGLQSEAGIVLSAETIFRCGVVLAAVRFLADANGMCRPQTMKHLAGGGKAPDPTHYSQRVLKKPNAWQTGYRHRAINMVWTSMWGNSFNKMVSRGRSFADELWPLHPARTRIVDQLNDGSLIYLYSAPDGTEEKLGADRVLHYRGVSLDGFRGAPTYQLIRNCVGVALAAEKHLSVFLRKGSRLAGLLVPAGPLEADKRKELKDSWNEVYGGSENTGTVGLLPFGVDFKPMAVDNQKAQLVEIMDRQVEDALRFLGVPGVVCGYGGKIIGYANAKEFFESGGIKHCVLPWMMNFEEEEANALLFDDGPHFIKRNLDVLMRANTESRFNALFKAVGRPWMTPNEAREIEDMNPDDDPQSDEIGMPTTMTTESESEEQEQPEPSPVPGQQPLQPGQLTNPTPGDDDEEQQAARLHGFAEDAAARVLRREISSIKGDSAHKGLATRFSRDRAAWEREVRTFYDAHATFVARTLRVEESRARAYAAEQRDELLKGGVAVIETWKSERMPKLLALAKEG